MLDTIDLSRKLEKSLYKERFKPLREDLALLGRKAFEADIPVIVVFEGWDASGKGSAIRRLVHELDPRGFNVHMTLPPTEEERHYPFLWRFWNRIPARGRIAFFDRSWYSRVLGERLHGELTREQWQEAYQEINQFERQLVDEGYVLVKLFLHVSRKELKKRFKQVKKRADEWRITDESRLQHKRYDEYLALSDEMLERTSTTDAPWTIVESNDRRYRRVKIFQTLVDALARAVERKAAEANAPPAKPEAEVRRALQGIASALDNVDLSVSMEREEYDYLLPGLQKHLRELEFLCYSHRLPVIVAYEGWDAAGKGGNIKRVTEELDPRGYEVVPIAAPKGDEAVRHYLWRFWRHVPKAGHLAIFDRTWYGRVLVERVEGFISREKWQRAYSEINEFERSLTNFGAVLVKFWIHLGKDEQLARFEERQNTPHKQYKITDEDWRNREKWDGYELAVSEMLERTSTSYAPWTVIEGNCKLYARVKALRTIIKAVESALDGRDEM